MLDPVIYDLNRYLAEEAREQARQERLEAIETAICQETRQTLTGENRQAAQETMAALCDHIPFGTWETLLLGIIRNEYTDTSRLLQHIFQKAQTRYIEHEAKEELKHLEAIEAENRALAGKI